MGNVAAPRELAPGLWSWGRRHPDWHPGDFGAEVVSFLARADDDVLLLDPLVLGDDDPAWQLIGSQVENRLHVLISIHYHLRSAEAVRDRYADEVPVTIHGHPSCAERLASTDGFQPLEPGDSLPAGVSAHAIGKPRRRETPLHLPSHSAILFGDAVVGTPEGPRQWTAKPIDEGVLKFHRERFAPTLEPLLELEPERLLMTHGPSYPSDGTKLLREAIDAPPWHHPG